MVLCSMAQHRDYPLYNLERSIEGLKEKKESLIEGEGGGGGGIQTAIHTSGTRQTIMSRGRGQ